MSIVVAASSPQIAIGWTLSGTPTVSSAVLTWTQIVNQNDMGYSAITGYNIY